MPFRHFNPAPLSPSPLHPYSPTAPLVVGQPDFLLSFQNLQIFAKFVSLFTLQWYEKIFKTHYFTIIPHSKRTILHKNKRHFYSLTPPTNKGLAIAKPSFNILTI